MQASSPIGGSSNHTVNKGATLLHCAWKAPPGNETEEEGIKAQRRVSEFEFVQSEIDEPTKKRVSGRDITRQERNEGIRKGSREIASEKNQFMEPKSCSRRSSTVHCISDDDPALCEVACDCGRCGRMLKDPESEPLDRFSIRRPICAELLKNT